MSEPMTYKGRLMSAAASLAVAGPWRGLVENGLRSFGHRHPDSRFILSASRHRGGKLIEREGKEFQRLVTFESGGQMLCSGDGPAALASVMYYFLGTITGQDEDEKPCIRMLARAVQPGDTVFDVGANLGFLFIFFGPTLRPIGIRPCFRGQPATSSSSQEISRAE